MTDRIIDYQIVERDYAFEIAEAVRKLLPVWQPLGQPYFGYEGGRPRQYQTVVRYAKHDHEFLIPNK